MAATAGKLLAARTTAIVPVLNEEELIGDVVSRLLRAGVGRVLVVDNGSSDGSGAAATAAGAEVVVERSRGYGEACWSGMQHLGPECEAVLFAAGDGQDDVSELPRLLEATEGADLVIGDRTATESSRRWLTMPQRFGNWLATTLMALGWGHRYHDLGAFRLIRKSTLLDMEMQDRGFGWTVEMQVKAAQPWREVRVAEVPVEYCPRLRGQSKISGTIKGSLHAGAIILLTIGQMYLQELSDMVMHPVARSPGAHRAAPRRWELASSREQQQWRGMPAWRQRLAYLSAFLLVYGALEVSLSNDTREAGAKQRFVFGCLLQLASYLALLGAPRIPLSLLWLAAWAARLLLLVGANTAGDDIFRFVWEGWLQRQGLSPYEHAPGSDVAKQVAEAAGSHYINQVRAGCNHPSVTSTYPPLAQLVFRAAAVVAPRVPHFKVLVTSVDMVITWLLSRQFGAHRAALYGWNPLVLLAQASGGHYDSMVVLPLVLGWLAFERGKWCLTSLLIGCSAAMKWVTLPFLGFVVLAEGEWMECLAAVLRLLWLASPRHAATRSPRGEWRQLLPRLGLTMGRSAAVLLLGLTPLALSAAPFCTAASCRLAPLSSDWARNARFNCFLPTLVAKAAPSWARQLSNYHFVALFALLLSGRFVLEALRPKAQRQARFAVFGEAFFLLLLSCSPIVHFWYFTWGLPFVAATGSPAFKAATFSVFLSFVPILYPPAARTLWQTLAMWLPPLGAAMLPYPTTDIPPVAAAAAGKDDAETATLLAEAAHHQPPRPHTNPLIFKLPGKQQAD